MATYYVICITKKPNHQDPHTAIQSYGVSQSLADETAKERWAQNEMIDILEKKTHVVKSMGKNPKTGETEFPELEVITKADGSKYVKSTNDGDKPDNLLSQRECKDTDAR